MNKKQKQIELDSASIIFMLLVIFIHVAAECVTKYNTRSVQFAIMCSAHRLSSFVVQGFIFLSGLKLFLPRSEKFSYSRFYISRFRRVVIPYVIAFLIFVAYFLVTGRINFDPIYLIKSFITGGMVGHFYFVAIICQFYILIPVWRFIAARCSPLLSVFTSLIVMMICNSYLPEIIKQISGAELTLNSHLFTSYLFYFICGIFAGCHYSDFCQLLKQRFMEITFLFVISGVIDCILIWVIRNGLYYPVWADNFHVIYCTFAILFTISVSLKLKDRNSIPNVMINRLSEISYYVYLIHPLFIFVCESLLARAGINSLSLRFILKSLFTYTLSIAPLVGFFELSKKITKKIKD